MLDERTHFLIWLAYFCSNNDSDGIIISWFCRLFVIGQKSTRSLVHCLISLWSVTRMNLIQKAMFVFSVTRFLIVSHVVQSYSMVLLDFSCRFYEACVFECLCLSSMWWSLKQGRAERETFLLPLHLAKLNCTPIPGLKGLLSINFYLFILTLVCCLSLPFSWILLCFFSILNQPQFLTSLKLSFIFIIYNCPT